MIVLAIVSGAAILVLGAIVLALIWAGRSTVRDISPQLRVAAPPKLSMPKDAPGDDGAHLAGPPFAGGSKEAS